MSAVRARARPLVRADFRSIARRGFGDAGNTYAHAMGWHDGKLYVGTTRHALCGGRPYDRSREVEVWPVYVPEIVWDHDWRGQIWRFDPETGALERVHQSAMAMGSRGFEIPREWGYRDMVSFRGRSDRFPALYVTSWGSHMGPGPHILRSEDGTRFHETVPRDRGLWGKQTLRALVQLRDQLFTIPTGRCGGKDSEHQSGGFVLGTRDPAQGDWEIVSPPFFGDPRNVTVFDLEVLGDFLYAGTMNPYTGMQVWKTRAEGRPPYEWTCVVSEGAGRGRLNEVACTFASFDGALYVGAAVYNLGFDRIFQVGPACPELIRIWPDDRWELLVGQARDTPQGLRVPTSGLGPGFGNPFCGYIWRMMAHRGWLYAGTAVWSPWIPFASRERWPESLKRFLGDAGEAEFLERFGGFDLWRSSDGDRWEPVTRNGFDNPYNCGIRTFVSSEYGLFLGTVNQFGPEIAMRRFAGWRYEPNSRGGAELWLGARPENDRPARHPQVCSERVEPGPDWVSLFYGGTSHRSVGCWRPGLRHAGDAAENLIEELLAFARPAASPRAPQYPDDSRFQRWLEERQRPRPDPTTSQSALCERDALVIGGGDAASAYLGRYFDETRLLAVNGDASGGPRGSWFRRVMPLRPRLPKESFDLALLIEQTSHPRGARALLAELSRALRPGGLVLGAHLEDPSLGGESPECPGWLGELGFHAIRAVDATECCARAFSDQWNGFCEARRDRGEATRAELSAAGSALPLAPERGSAVRYWLFAAVRR